MKASDHIVLALSNLWKRKLRTFLTAFGVTIGIGALVSMVSFGKGMQKNLTEAFRSLDLFSSITVFAEDFMTRERFDPDERTPAAPTGESARVVLDDSAVERIGTLNGVDTVFPEIRIPALVRFNDREEFRLVQVIPAKIVSSKWFRFGAGRGYGSDDENSAVLSSSFLRRMGIDDPENAVGKTVTVSSISFDFSRLNLLDLAASLGGDKLPFRTEDYELTVAGVTERLAFSGPLPIQSDVFITPGASQQMARLPFSNIWDIFLAKEGRLGYSALNVRLSSPAFVEPVKKEISEMGFWSFALADQFEEVQRGFLIMNMILAAVGMIAIVVASLGIVNTMVMSILERYSEIGIMKAVGANDRDIRRIFFFESSAIGFLGGVFGLALGWAVSGIINRIVNFFLSRQGVPSFQYFSFPVWLCLGAIAFSVAVSLAAGIYPAMRAARVDPVRALRHD